MAGETAHLGRELSAFRIPSPHSHFFGIKPDLPLSYQIQSLSLRQIFHFHLDSSEWSPGMKLWWNVFTNSRVKDNDTIPNIIKNIRKINNTKDTI